MTTPSPHYLDKARRIFLRAGGNPDNSKQLATWGQQMKDEGRGSDYSVQAIVAEDGTIVATCSRRGHNPHTWRIDKTEQTDAWGAADLPDDRGCAIIRKAIGQQVITVSMADFRLG